jgi:arylsulfatase A-like enzyme
MTNLPQRCKEVDQGAAALIKDLKSRGLLEDTLVIWGGEFGRQPMAQSTPTKQDAGRDHLRTAFTIWMAGGGIKRGAVVGQTDEFGLASVEDPIHVHDLQATILHCLGIDHTRLTYKFQGRDFRLTDVEGTVATKLLS